MDYSGLVLRYLHIFSAVGLAGGVYFWRFVIVPATSRLDPDVRQRAIAEIVRPWSRVVMITSGILMASGLYNLVMNIKGHTFGGQPYHMAGGLKLMFAMGLFFLAARLAGRSDAARRAREQLSFWCTINAILATLLLLLGGWMKSMPHDPKPSAASDAMIRPIHSSVADVDPISDQAS